MRPKGSAIRAIRMALKMSLPTLSADTGIDKGHLSRVERGLAGLSDERIEQVAEALHVTPAAITHEETT